MMARDATAVAKDAGARDAAAVAKDAGASSGCCRNNSWALCGVRVAIVCCIALAAVAGVVFGVQVVQGHARGNQ